MLHFSERHFANKLNDKFDEYNLIATSVIAELKPWHSAISVWNTPAYLMRTEEIHHPDGIHFQLPGTLGKVDMVFLDFISKARII